ncbi:hypothetical protein BGZ51_002517 [Haplosporangium sp. Z 767]|nr:hypothetical protein BGZ51_002517 [Haplosporangium sp. Z 767]KAF9186421.1 hypothetical protein BGZ50_002467 [Haplosporangium sp. Z 11]
MAIFCNKDDNRSSSEYPPFCCVHVQGSESQPLLGYHHHSPQLDSAQHQPPQYYQQELQDEYRINLDEKAGIPSSSRYSSASSSNCSSKDCKKSKKRKLWGRILVLILIGWFYYTFSHSSHCGYDQDYNLLNMNNGSHRDGLSSHDYCRDNVVDWDGPSTIVSAGANDYKLTLGKGNFDTQLHILTGLVSEPTLRISGKVSPDNGNDDGNKDDDNAVVVNDGDHREFSRLGLHIEVVQVSQKFEAQIWFEDRSAVDKKNGYEYRACARLNIELVLPEKRDDFGSLVIHGNVLTLDAHGLQGIGFDHMDLSVNVGDVRTKDLIKADKFATYVNTGMAVVESVQVKTEGNALDVKTTSTTGRVALGVKTTSVSESIYKSSTNAHRIEVATSTGAVQLDVQPSSSLSMDNKHLGHLKVRVHTSTGSIKNNIRLASPAQVLDLVAGSEVGSVESIISDEFLGHFDLQTRLGSAIIQAARGSDSTIKFEKKTGSSKVGTKAGQNQRGEGSIELRAVTGKVALIFKN